MFRNRHAAGAVLQTDYAGQTVPVIDPATGAQLGGRLDLLFSVFDAMITIYNHK